MDLGICVASHVTDIDYIVRAEALGFSHAWLADSQMLWSDCYAALALAAVRTSRIRLGTGVAVSGTRPAPVNAAGIATINALAPGRTFFGIGAGNTARRVMGLPPQRIREFERYLKTLIPLLKGEEAEFELDGSTHPIRHIMPDRGFVNFADPIPLYISGMMWRIGCELPPSSNSASSPFSRGISVFRYCSNSRMRCGGRPITRLAVLPAPMPKNVRPGASALMVAIPAALTGAGRVPLTATPVPSRMRLVRTAASASAA